MLKSPQEGQPMSTETFTKRTRAEINRDNAQKSTGPRTDEGKAKASLNALRHGLTSRVICMPHEDLEAFKAFTAAWHEDFKPVGVRETYLTQSIAEHAWRMNGFRAMESNVLALAFHSREEQVNTGHPESHAAMAIADGLPKRLPTLQLLSTTEQRVHKQWASMTRELEQLQAARKIQEAQDLEEAANLLEMHEANHHGPDAHPYDPAEDGFVFHLSQIHAYIARQTRRRTSLSFGEKRLHAGLDHPHHH